MAGYMKTGLLKVTDDAAASASGELVIGQASGVPVYHYNNSVDGTLATLNLAQTFTGLQTFSAGATVASGHTLTLDGATLSGTIAGTPTWSGAHTFTNDITQKRDGNYTTFDMRTYQNGSTNYYPILSTTHGRGTASSPAQSLNGDVLSQFQVYGTTSAPALQLQFSIRTTAIADITTSGQSKVDFRLGSTTYLTMDPTSTGSITLSKPVTIGASGGIGNNYHDINWGASTYGLRMNPSANGDIVPFRQTNTNSAIQYTVGANSGSGIGISIQGSAFNGAGAGIYSGTTYQNTVIIGDDFNSAGADRYATFSPTAITLSKPVTANAQLTVVESTDATIDVSHTPVASTASYSELKLSASGDSSVEIRRYSSLSTVEANALWVSNRQSGGAIKVGALSDVSNPWAAFSPTAITLSKPVTLNYSAAPASAGATGTAGQIAWDTNYIYICTATNTWKRVAIATW